MAYKYQLGEARMSGSLIQEGNITANSSHVFTTDLSASADTQVGGDLTVAGAVNLAASGEQTNVRGGLTVVEDSLFSSMLQIDGTLDCNSTAEIQGDLSLNSAFKGSVTAVSGSYTIASGVYILTADSTSNSFTVTLPAASSNSGRIIMVKDSGGNSHSNNITISRNGSDVIDGEASIVLESPYAAVTLVCNGSNWFIL